MTIPEAIINPQYLKASAEMKERNQQLAAQYSVKGFPTIILLSPEGKELARQVGYGGGGVTWFIDWANKNLK